MKKYFVLLMGLLFNCGLHAADSGFGPFDCSKKDGISFLLTRRSCNSEGDCSLWVQLMKKDAMVYEIQAGQMLQIPDGKIKKDGKHQWTVSTRKPLPADSVSSGNVILSVESGRGPSGSQTILVSTTRVGGDLPFSTYEYYVCDGNTTWQAWSGMDSGSAAMATVKLKDSDKDGVDEISVKGEAFEVNQETIKNMMFQWDATTHKMAAKPAKGKKN